MTDRPDRKIILEDGSEYLGRSFGSDRDKILEIVFNTSMAGYQEILSDPSYTDQAVVMTYPIIGSYGTAADDYETDIPSIGALIVREYNGEPSNFRSAEALGDVMSRYGICGISGVDTRKLTRSIRDRGSRKALLTSADVSLEEGLRRLGGYEPARDAVSRVSCREPRVFGAEDARFHVAAVDCGMKRNIVRSLVGRGCRVTAVPWNASAELIRSLRPDGIFLSNGPGDPTDVPETIETVRALIGFRPIFGICLGHQILSLAFGAKTYKLKFGHRGGNHPVKDLETGRVEITSQNHSYAVDAESLRSTPLTVTHLNLLDGTVEGLKDEKDRVFSVQFHPESSPGPRDSGHLFDRFIRMMEVSGGNA
ncbi:MAG: glutamine-hydrolyzing carbamoyl-phosphate synthase small subunit [Oscillospiraceae bacterium]|jgi:carbamoyl-phosphate synthase small subunit|nr:glutamine-hydrolyzing carbamoyl-phosphate synthase small subunit [Oscillospiraceae bacterium]